MCQQSLSRILSNELPAKCKGTNTVVKVEIEPDFQEMARAGVSSNAARKRSTIAFLKSTLAEN